MPSTPAMTTCTGAASRARALLRHCESLSAMTREIWREGHHPLAAHTGTMLFITSSGLPTPSAEMPIPDFPVPYAAPRLEKMRANAAPMNPSKGAFMS